MSKRMEANGHRGSGSTKSPTYHSWASMRNRCYNPKVAWWHCYGGKGIKVCDRWRKFANFLEDMGERPPGLTLDRIDSSKDYGPDNCRWVTPKEQSRWAVGNTNFIKNKNGKFGGSRKIPFNNS